MKLDDMDMEELQEMAKRYSKADLLATMNVVADLERMAKYNTDNIEDLIDLVLEMK